MEANAIARRAAPLPLAAQAFAEILQEIEDNDALPKPRPLDSLVMARFALLRDQLAESVDERIALKQQMDDFIAGCKRREDAIRAVRKKVEVYLDGLKAGVKAVMLEHPNQPYKGQLGTIKLQKNGGKPALRLRFPEDEKTFRHCIDPEAAALFEVPDEFLETITITRLRTDDVRQALGTGRTFPWAALERDSHARFD